MLSLFIRVQSCGWSLLYVWNWHSAYYGEQLDQLSRLAASVVGGVVVDVVGGVVGCQAVSQCQ